MATQSKKKKRIATKNDSYELSSTLAEIGDVPWRELCARAIAASPSPRLAESGLERLVDAGGADSLTKAWPADKLEDLAVFLGSSSAITRFLAGLEKNWVKEAEAYDRPNPSAAELRKLAKVSKAADLESLAKRLRAMARRELFRIGARDLLGLATLDETLEGITRLAEVAVDLAVKRTRERMEAERGVVRKPDGEPVSFTVIGLGKLGGGDLNYSSDIDVLYLYETDEVADDSPAARDFFGRLAADVTKAVGDTTEDGIVFRVDLRLRPEGDNGPIVNPFRNALTYYEGWGDTWERGVYIKARPIAGDATLGREFIDAMQAFVFRRHLDFQTVEDFRSMKERIDAEQLIAVGADENARNVKLGRGGIRELEFVVQILQIIHGGHVDQVRVGGTMKALNALTSRGMINPDMAAELKDAYEFLRNVEHAIQVVEQRQTQRLPDDDDGLLWLARRLGYGCGRRGQESGGDAREEFERDWERHTHAVHHAFLTFLELRSPGTEDVDGSSQNKESDPRGRALLTLIEKGDDERAMKFLVDMGFSDSAAEVAVENLQRIYRGSVSGPASPQRKRAVAAMLPALLSAAVRSADPESAIERLVEFLIRTGAHTSYLVLLGGSSATMEVLVRLFATSPYLASHLVGHPELIDTIVRSDTPAAGSTVEDLLYRLRQELGQVDGAEVQDGSAGDDDHHENEEQIFSNLRTFKNAELIRVGLADLADLLDDRAVHHELTALADACLIAASEAARRIVERCEPGLTDGIDLAIVAMGKMGGREMSYGSDLDLLFVYATEQEGFDGDAHAIATRWVQKIISLLQSRTAEGVVYPIDARLRPSGKSGPLVTTLDRFEEYHAKEAQLWERQAHIRARPVFGSETLRTRVDEAVRRFVYSDGLSKEQLTEIDDLRRRVEDEASGEGPDKLNLKTGRGGLVDIEFIVQMLLLRYGATHDEIRSRNTIDAIEKLKTAKLLDAKDAKALTTHYQFLRRVEARLRLEVDRPVEAMVTDTDMLAPLARRLGFDGNSPGRKLLAKYEKTCDAVRSIYERFFDPKTF